LNFLKIEPWDPKNNNDRSSSGGSEKGEVLLRVVLTPRYFSRTQPARLWKASCLQTICSWFDNPPQKVVPRSWVSRSASHFSHRNLTPLKSLQSCHGTSQTHIFLVVQAVRVHQHTGAANLPTPFLPTAFPLSGMSTRPLQPAKRFRLRIADSML
jgi:hypothetical protein